MNEEELKFQWRTSHPELDLEYFEKYDARSKDGSLIIEFKKDCSDWKKMITQSILTAAKKNLKYKFIGAVSQQFPEGKFIDLFDCKISIRAAKTFNAVPSKWNTPEWDKAHKSLFPLYKERSIPTKEELELVKEAYQFQNKFTQKEKEIINLGFDLTGNRKKLKETEWAVPEDIRKENAYFTPENLRLKVRELVNRNWPDIKYIWDPFGGDGALVNQFNNKEIFISDIVILY